MSRAALKDFQRFRQMISAQPKRRVHQTVNAVDQRLGDVGRIFQVGSARRSVSQGNYAASVGFLPFVSAPMVSAAKVTLVAAGAGVVMTVVDGVLRPFRDQLDDIGLVLIRDTPRRYRGPPGASPTIIVGTGQVTDGASGALHAAHSEHLANLAADSGGAVYATLDRKLRLATGRNDLGNAGNLEPDLVVVRRDANGRAKVDIYELQSCSQRSPAQVALLIQKLDDMMNALPSELRGSSVFVPLGDYFDPALCD